MAGARDPCAGHVAVEDAVHGIVLEEMRKRLRVGEIVHRHEIEVGDALFLGRAHHLPADAAESVDPDLDRHRDVRS
jgi:hypothetical protein